MFRALQEVAGTGFEAPEAGFEALGAALVAPEAGFEALETGLEALEQVSCGFESPERVSWLRNQVLGFHE